MASSASAAACCAGAAAGEEEEAGTGFGVVVGAVGGVAPISSGVVVGTPISSGGGSFKVVVLGDGGVGKTTWLQHCLCGEFLGEAYNPTFGLFVQRLALNTTHGVIALHMAEVAGQDRFGGYRDSYSQGAAAAVIMFDVTRPETYDKVPAYHQMLLKSEATPVVLIGNKVDVGTQSEVMRKIDQWDQTQGECTYDADVYRKVSPKKIQYHRGKHMQYYDISAKSGYNVEKPLRHLARHLLQAPDLELVAECSSPAGNLASQFAETLTKCGPLS